MYKIVNITIDSTNNELKYEFTDLFKAYKSDISIEDYTSGTIALKELLGGFYSYVKTNNPKVTDSQETDDNGSAIFNNVELGQYIIVGSGNTQGALVYQTVSVEVAPFVESNVYKIYDKYDVVMKTTEPEFEKRITAGTVADVEDTRRSASIGDKVTYQLEASVPVYSEGATNTTFYIGDKLSDGLKAPTTIKVKGYVGEDTKGEDVTDGFTANITGQQIYVDFVYEKIKTYSRVVVSYDAELDSDATIGGLGNANDAKLVYCNEPFTGTTTTDRNLGNGYATKIDGEKVYTYGIKIDKYNKDDKSEKLEGVEFKLYSDPACTSLEKTVTTDSTGSATIKGIKAGTYYLKETKALAGYKLKKDVDTVIVNGDNTSTTGGYVTAEVPNTKGGTLPSTGGIGTIIFIVVGIGLAGGAAILLITKKRIKNMN